MKSSKLCLFTLLHACTPPKTVGNVGARPYEEITQTPEPTVKVEPIASDECTVLYVNQASSGKIPVFPVLNDSTSLSLNEGVLVCALGKVTGTKWLKIKSGTIEGFADRNFLECEKGQTRCDKIKPVATPPGIAQSPSKNLDTTSPTSSTLSCTVELPKWNLFVWSWIECKSADGGNKLANFKPGSLVTVLKTTSPNGKRQLASHPYCYFDQNNIDESKCQ